MKKSCIAVFLVLIASLGFASGSGEDAAAGDGVPTVTFFFQQGAPEGEVGLRLLEEAEAEVGVNVEFDPGL